MGSFSRTNPFANAAANVISVCEYREYIKKSSNLKWVRFVEWHVSFIPPGLPKDLVGRGGPPRRSSRQNLGARVLHTNHLAKFQPPHSEHIHITPLNWGVRFAETGFAGLLSWQRVRVCGIPYVGPDV